MSVNFGGTQTRSAKVAPPSALQQQAAATQGQALQGTQQALGQVGQFAGQAQPLATQALGNLGQMTAQGGMSLSPQQQQYIQQMFANPTQQAMTALQQAAQNAAASRGMSIADSPIGADYLKQIQLLQGNIAGQQANAALQYGQQAFGNNQALAQQYANLLGQQTTGGLNLSGAAGAANQQQAQQQQFASPLQFQTPTTYGMNIGQVGQGLSGLAQAASTPVGQSIMGGIGSGISGAGSAIGNIAGGAGSWLGKNLFGQTNSAVAPGGGSLGGTAFGNAMNTAAGPLPQPSYSLGANTSLDTSSSSDSGDSSWFDNL